MVGPLFEAVWHTDFMFGRFLLRRSLALITLSSLLSHDCLLFVVAFTWSECFCRDMVGLCPRNSNSPSNFQANGLSGTTVPGTHGICSYFWIATNLITKQSPSLTAEGGILPRSPLRGCVSESQGIIACFLFTTFLWAANLERIVCSF